MQSNEVRGLPEFFKGFPEKIVGLGPIYIHHLIDHPFIGLALSHDLLNFESEYPIHVITGLFGNKAASGQGVHGMIQWLDKVRYINPLSSNFQCIVSVMFAAVGGQQIYIF
ncbi:MAG: hypothetical protein P8Y12_07075 [Gammaproteobacteria bacterium]